MPSAAATATAAAATAATAATATVTATTAAAAAAAATAAAAAAASCILGSRTRNNPPACNMQRKNKNQCNNQNRTEIYHDIPLPGKQGEMSNGCAAPYANHHDTNWLNIHLKKHCDWSVG
jgi:hypothetical protein